jgi:hypothetical protein
MVTRILCYVLGFSQYDKEQNQFVEDDEENTEDEDEEKADPVEQQSLG